MSLKQIGTGKPVLVFVYDPGLSVSLEQAEHINRVRDQLGDSVLFLMAKIGTPDGDQLIAKHRAQQAELLFFDPSGVLIKRAFGLKKSGELIQWLTIEES